MDRIDKLRLRLEKYSDRTPKDERLCQLILNICLLSQDNPQRRKLVDRLFRQLQILPKLSRVSHPYYLEAQNKTWQWLEKHLHEFNPQRSPIQSSLITWVNGHLRYRIQDLYTSKHQKVFSLDFDLLETSGFYKDNLDAFDIEIERIEIQQKQAVARAIVKYINGDPEYELRNCYPRNRPDCNCQILVQRLFLQQSPEKMAVIARQLNIKTQTIYSFWKRTGLLKLQRIGRHIAQKDGDFISY
ncbi:hypothetical protein [Tychonema sp. BBK16]|uniref:hypothetical protein n=1 Tax=Tychonema sp. BBK16 TaxID=2699888 RepID=UPI001F4541DF|nr:hypothetical protein [Tychonema sp. BBK16]MCF6371909.1 hypothetical protein [Tychonema sp. BBK16]